MAVRTSGAAATMPIGTAGDVSANSSTVAPEQPRLRHELRNNLAVAGFSLGLSVIVAVGLSLLMMLLG